MVKTLDIVLVALVLGAAAWTFQVKHEAEELETEIARIDREIRSERETIALLEADWSLLDQPNRLQHLAEAFKEELALAPIDPQQIAQPDELPARPAEPELPEDLVGGLLAQYDVGASR